MRSNGRRRLAGLAGAAALALVASACSQAAPTASGTPQARPTVDMSSASQQPAESGTPSGTAAPAGTCLEASQQLTREQRVGQLLMVGITGDFDDAEKRLIQRHEIGSVLLMGNFNLSIEQTRGLTGSIGQASGATPILIAVDQEGGLVQRLRGPGFDAMPSAADQAKLGPAELRTSAARWGKQMADAGVHVNLAPVGDVVPAAKVGTNEPVGKLKRGYGSDPKRVGQHVEAYVRGMHDGGLGTSVKHFPGLGEVVGNTDFSANVKDTVTTADSRSLAPFQDGVDAGTDTVMVSTAYYTKIDPSAPAAFSPKVIRLIRDDLGFAGVVISDDLGAAASMKDVPAAQRGVRFVKAGGDLAITADPAHASNMAVGLLAEAQRDPEFDEQVTQAAARVLGLKAKRGLAQCTDAAG